MSHVHTLYIAAPNGPTSKGTCPCGYTRIMQNWLLTQYNGPRHVPRNVIKESLDDYLARLHSAEAAIHRTSEI